MEKNAGKVQEICQSDKVRNHAYVQLGQVSIIIIIKMSVAFVHI